MEKVIDKQWFCEKLSALPNETERAFEIGVVELALSAPEKVIEPILEEIIQNRETSDKIAYGAYCTLHTCYRRMKDHSQLVLLERRFGARFSDHPSRAHFELLAFVDMGEKLTGEQILEKAELSVKQMPDNAGSQHLLADLVVSYYEENPEILETSTGEVLQRHLRWISRGVEAVDKAIALDDYPKFYCTKGRLLCLQHKSAEALFYIKQAIDKEDSSRSDYAIRIATYLSQKMKIESIMREEQMQKDLKTYRSELMAKQDAAEREIGKQMATLNDSTVKNLEFLGLFAGIVSFTIGGVNIVSNASTFSFQGAAGLLIVLMGALLEVFCGFGIILHGWTKQHRSRNLLVLLFGLIMITAGLLLCIYL